MRRIFLTILFLSLFVLLPTGSFAAVIPGTTTPVEALAANLEWAFAFSHESMTQEDPSFRKDVWKFRSVEPYSEKNGERTYLRFSLQVYRFEEEQDAADQFSKWNEKGDPSIGFTYSWGRVYQRGRILYRLDVPCLFSQANVGKITASLTAGLSVGEAESLRAIYCRCGAGCAGGEYSRQDGFRENAGSDSRQSHSRVLAPGTRARTARIFTSVSSLAD